ncbi:hypothetical protein [Kineothrix alysoides]|nr:hypothetical protein [Kineothrix alysoides]
MSFQVSVSKKLNEFFKELTAMMDKASEEVARVEKNFTRQRVK